MEKKVYVQPTITVVCYSRFCDSEFGDWGSGVEDGAGKGTDFEADDDDDFGFSFGENGYGFTNPSHPVWE